MSNRPHQPIIPLHHDASASSTSSTTVGSDSSTMYTTQPLSPGYPALANKMGLIPELGIFRRFGMLSNLNLLYRQAELVEKEKELIQLQRKDEDGDSEQKEYAADWWFLCHSKENGEARGKQWAVFKDIQKLLHEYNEAVLQQVRILRLEPPGDRDLSWLQNFFETYEMGPLALNGEDCALWGSLKEPHNHAPDLFTLLPRQDEDTFSKWISSQVIPRLRALEFLQSQKFAEVKHMIGCEDNELLRWTYFATTILASTLPILAISTLYLVRSLKVRVGVIAIFNLLLSFCLFAFTKSRRTDIFAVSATFAAVQVVFVQVDVCSSRGNGL